MATYTTNGGIKKIATGDESGTWGTSTNTNFDIIDRLTNGVVSITLTGATETVTTSDGTISDGMSKVLVFGGTPGVAVTVTIAPNDAQKVYFIKNDCGQTITISQGSGSTVDILDGSSSIVYCDGAGAGAAVVEITAGSSATNTIDVTSFTATAAQTDFSVTYTVGSIAVYQNGVLLRDTTDYTATNGTSVVLAAGATSGDAIDVVAYATFTVTDTYTKAQSDARYSQVANNLSDLTSAATALTNLGVTATAAELNYNDITTLGTVEASKVVTADANGDVTFPDGEKAVFGTGSDLQIYHDGSNSIIDENGTGNLQIKVGGATKLSTSSTGITVTGTAIATTDTDTTNSGSVTLDFGANQNFVLTLTGNVTLANPTTEQVGQSGFIVFIQDATGGRTVSLGTDYETAGGAGLTLSSAASTTDVVPYIVAASGRILLGAPQLAFA